MPLFGFQDEDVTFIRENDASMFTERYPTYEYRALATTVRRDPVLGDLEDKSWATGILIPLMIQHVEQEEVDSVGLQKFKLNFNIVFSEQLLITRGLDPKPGDIIVYTDGTLIEILFIRMTDPLGNTNKFLHRLARGHRYEEVRTYVTPATLESSTASVSLPIVQDEGI